jgi:hypothetical protein
VFHKSGAFLLVAFAFADEQQQKKLGVRKKKA